MNLPELLKIAEVATPGEWQNYKRAVYLPDSAGGFDIGRSPNALANAEFIAAFSPSVAIELIKRLQEAEKILEENKWRK